jgi:Ca2+-binding RTX toxin-like protein
MATLTVTTAADVVNPSDGALSLREAVQETNLTAAADTIVFAPALEGRTLVLTQGELFLTPSVTVDGDRDDNGSRVTLDGNGDGRVLFIGSGYGAAVTLDDLAITGGRVLDQNGAGIYVARDGALRVTGCTLSGNFAANSDRFGPSQGGALFAAEGSRVTIEASTFGDNYARTGGAVSSRGDALIVRDSLVADNRAGYRGVGGAIAFVDGALTIERSTIAGSYAAYGGGLALSSCRATIATSTIAGNVAAGAEWESVGGGIRAYQSTLVLIASTITGNRVLSDRGALGAGVASIDGVLDIADSIVAGNFYLGQAQDIAGSLNRSNGHNIFGSDVAGSVDGDVEGVNPARLFAAIDPVTEGGFLALNGGPTPTVALRDALGNPALSGADPLDANATDQRGVPRPLPGRSNPDIGSLELNQGAISTRPSDNNDVLTGSVRGDTLVALAGNDLVRGLGGSDDVRGVSGSDTLLGGDGGDRLAGGSGQDLLIGEDGRDLLLGGSNADTLFGGAGDDVLRGQGGPDRLQGERGHDRFDIDSGDTGVGAGRRDLILDFAQDADRIDLASIDARSGVAGDQAFAFLGTRAFTGAGQLRYASVGLGTVIQGSTDADAAPELELQLAGQIALASGDFLL